MQARDEVGVAAAEGGGDPPTPITADREETLITQALHQLHPSIGGALHRPPRALRLAAEPEARQGRRHDMEGGCCR